MTIPNKVDLAGSNALAQVNPLPKPAASGNEGQIIADGGKVVPAALTYEQLVDNRKKELNNAVRTVAGYVQNITRELNFSVKVVPSAAPAWAVNAPMLTAVVAAAIETADSDVTATATTAVNMGAFTAHAGAADGTTFTLNVAGVSMVYTAASSTGITAAGVQSAVTSAASSLTSAGISVSGTVAGGDLTFTDADGDNIVFTSAASAGTAAFATASATQRGTVSLTSNGDLVIAGTNASRAGLTAGTTTASANTLDVSTVDGANDLIEAVDAALNTVNGARATLGAVQNRFESVVTSLQTSSESLSAARSRIQDADFAAETANLTKTQILQQAGTAMLAQANQLPQGVLSLLR